jgi:hypothetical protein
LDKQIQKQTSLWVEISQLQARGRHFFHGLLSEIHDGARLDAYVERSCRKDYAPSVGRPSIALGGDFRCFLMGVFDGTDSERGIACRVSESLSLWELLGPRLVVQRSGKVDVVQDATGPVQKMIEVGVERMVAAKRYHGKSALHCSAEVGVGTVIAETERKRQKLDGQSAAQEALYAKRRLLDTQTARALMRRRGELVERRFVHLYDTGGMSRVHLCGGNNAGKRELAHAADFNLSLRLRQVLGVGTARQAADLILALRFALLRLIQAGNRTRLAMESGRPTSRRTSQKCRHQSQSPSKATLSTDC